MTLIEYQEASVNLQNRILKEKYYVPQYLKSLAIHKITIESIDNKEHDKKILNSFWNDFWFILPDNEFIRTGPFFPLCNLCEEMFEE